MSSDEIRWKEENKTRTLFATESERLRDHTACTVPVKNAKTWEDETYERLRRLNIYFCMIRLGGSLDSPYNAFHGRTSKAFRTYATVLSIISFVFTVRNWIFFFVPSWVPSSYVVLMKGSGKIARYALPLWSTATTILRIVLVRLLYDEDFPRGIRQMLWDIPEDPHLKGHGMSANSHPLLLCVPSLLFMFFFSIFAVSAFTRYKLSPLDPVFYTLSCQVFLYHSSFEVISWYVGLVTFKHVLPLLEITNQRFLAAVATVNAESLREAIACHDKCWNLVKCVDRVAGCFMGVCLTIALPTTVIMVSFLGTVRKEGGTPYPVIIWTICFFTSIGCLTYLTGSVYSAIHLPDEILTRKVYTCSVFSDIALQFRQRFANRAIGYTYFGFATFRKETFLTILNLVATYVVVGFQLRANVQTENLSNRTSTQQT